MLYCEGLAHLLAGACCEKVGAILPLPALMIQQTHGGLVDQGGCLEAVALALALHEVVSQAAKLFINDVERTLVSVAPGTEQLAYVVRIRLTGLGRLLHRLFAG